MLRNSLLSSSPISKENRTTTSCLSSEKYLSLKTFSFAISKETGVEISTLYPRNSESAVAEDPIIWFITSRIALWFISSSSNSSGGISIPIIIPTMMRTSSRLNMITFLPDKPSTYWISTPTAGSISLNTNSLRLCTDTFGVVIFVEVPSMVETAVAEAPRLMFIISPMASSSISLKTVSPISCSPSLIRYCSVSQEIILLTTCRYPWLFVSSF